MSMYISYRHYEEEDFDIGSMGFKDTEATTALLNRAVAATPKSEEEKTLLDEYIRILRALVEHQKTFNAGKTFADRMREQGEERASLLAESSAKEAAVAISHCEQSLFALEQLEDLQSILNRDDSKVSAKKENDTALENVKSVFLPILFSALGLLEFYLIYAIGILIVGLVFLVLSYIPILGAIAGWLLRLGDNTPDMFAIMIAVYLAYFGTTATGEHLIKKEKTQNLTFMLVGILLTTLNVVFLIVNVLHSDAILANVILALAGIAIFIKGKNG